MIHDKSILVGACDWDHPQWLETFYPQDLPADWRLSYYANEFSTVLVPEAKWRADDVDFEQWAQDMPEGFRFYFISDDLHAETAEIKTQMGNAFAGFIPVNGNTEAALINFENKTLRGWKQWLLLNQCSVIFLKDHNLQAKQLSDFQSLVQLMNL